jgi:hypothetical protein
MIAIDGATFVAKMAQTDKAGPRRDASFCADIVRKVWEEVKRSPRSTAN